MKNKNCLTEPENNVHDIEELAFHNNIQLVADIIKQWQEKSPDNKPLKHLNKAVTEIGIYALQMQKRQRMYDDQISKWREKTNKYKQTNEQLEKTIKQYEKFYR